MKKTDYTRIAPIYDQAAVRHDIPVDAELAARVDAGRVEAVLDVACGTGNYLRVQREAHARAPIRWHGLDASEAMLARARDKLLGTAAGSVEPTTGVVLVHGSAEALPYEDASFDYVSCNFAFHHFEKKERALDELVRVLRPDGALRLANIVPERMPGWWVFRFFPDARPEDQKRFWALELIVHELEQRGLSVVVELRTTLMRRPAADLHREARGRDQSSVAIVSEACFQTGLEDLARLAARGASVPDEQTIMTLVATR